MGYVKDPVARAQGAKTKVQAARLHQELDAELGLADHGADWDAQAEQAMDVLEAKAGEHDWGDLADLDATTAYTHAGGGHRLAHTWAPRLSRRASHRLDQADGDTPKRLRRGGHPAGRPEPKPSPRKRAARQRVGALLEAGRGDLSAAYGALPDIPGAGTTRELATAVIAGALALSFLFLLLRDSENPRRGWPSAVQTAVASVTNAIMAIVRPVDPLRPRSAAPAVTLRQAAQSGSAVGTPLDLTNVPGLTPTPPVPPRRRPTSRLPLTVSAHRAGTP
jgi:hypothetical protein